MRQKWGRVSLVFSMRRILTFFVLCVLVAIIDGAQAPNESARAADDMNAVAERYVHLVLALGQHDPDYVDAFYGPAEWKTQAEKEKKSLDAIGVEAAELMKKIGGAQASHSDAATALKSGDELVKLRREIFGEQILVLGVGRR